MRKERRRGKERGRLGDWPISPNGKEKELTPPFSEYKERKHLGNGNRGKNQERGTR